MIITRKGSVYPAGPFTIDNVSLSMNAQFQNLVQKALGSMPAQTRDILIRSRYQSQTNKEIATELHLSVKAVEYHVTKALKILRTVLKDYFPLWLLYF